MHTRHQLRNLPTELLRALTTISETGSFSKAAIKLHLSQPAITAQVRRLQALVGGDLFNKTPGGVAINERGRMVLDLARQMLEANDQILSLTGGLGEQPSIRVGISNVYIDKFLSASRMLDTRATHIYCGGTMEIGRALHEGQVEVACCFDLASSTRPVAEWQQRFVWVRSPSFMIRPDEPIPIVAWPGGFLGRLTTDSLTDAGLKHRIVFAGQDISARKAAVAAGLGLTVLPAELVDGGLILAGARILPQIPNARAGISVRRGVDPARVRAVVDALRKVAPPEGQPEPMRSSA